MTKSNHNRGKGDEGAALVEFALVAPILFLLIFGVIEFGWAFSQNMDVRHGARETARLAAVNYGTGAGHAQTADLLAEGCDRMDEHGDTTIEADRGGTGAVGDPISITVTRPLDTLTGFLDFALGGKTLESEVVTRAERPITWVDTIPPHHLCA